MRGIEEIRQMIIQKQEEISEDISSQNSFETTKRKYNRISPQKRDKLLEKIFFQHKKIKCAAKELNINYSSAKTILHLYRKKAKKHAVNQVSKCTKRCGFKMAPLVPTQQLNQVQIVISQGGRQFPVAQNNQLQKVQQQYQNLQHDLQQYQQSGNCEDSSTLSMMSIKKEDSTYSNCYSPELTSASQFSDSQQQNFNFVKLNRFQQQYQLPQTLSIFHKKQPVFC